MCLRLWCHVCMHTFVLLVPYNCCTITAFILYAHSCRKRIKANCSGECARWFKEIKTTQHTLTHFNHQFHIWISICGYFSCNYSPQIIFVTDWSPHKKADTVGCWRFIVVSFNEMFNKQPDCQWRHDGHVTSLQCRRHKRLKCCTGLCCNHL